MHLTPNSADPIAAAAAIGSASGSGVDEENTPGESLLERAF